MPRAWNSLVTDFPNYYLAARLAREGVDTSRMYEWEWLQREKDLRAVNIRVIGLIPITPFSTLVVWPLTGFTPLTAKRLWILLNLALLIPISLLLRAMTGLSYRRIALALAVNFPLYRNLEFGQFYILLLLLILAACWAYLRGAQALAGSLVAIAAACKIFPALFFVFFLQRKAWRSLLWGAITGTAALALSVVAFGWNVHRTYFYEVLPWALHGEAMPPYVANASISGILHRLFLSEPQWNPHPWHYSPLWYSLLTPALEMLFLAPAILLIRAQESTRRRTLLEWSALLTASLAVSTIPASYNFVLMAFPVCVLAAILLQRERYGWLAILLIAYIGIGFPTPSPQGETGLAIFLYTPRLPLMLGVLLGIYWLLWRDDRVDDRIDAHVEDRIGVCIEDRIEDFSRAPARDWTRYARIRYSQTRYVWTRYACTRYVWTAAMAVFVITGVRSTLIRERGVRQEYAYRLPLQDQGFLNAHPQEAGLGFRYVAFTLNGYRVVSSEKNTAASASLADPPDDFSYTSSSGHLMVERAGSPLSEIVDLLNPSRVIVSDGRDPMLSADGQSLAFVRDDHGRGRLMLRTAYLSGAASDIALTPPSLNVYEAAFLSKDEYAVSGVEGSHPPGIYLTDREFSKQPHVLDNSRYPAYSPDGRWIAYSHSEHGVWNLWIFDRHTGTTQQVSNVPCNELQPAWLEDSKTLLYSTDCGRSLWFTAVARRKVIP